MLNTAVPLAFDLPQSFNPWRIAKTRKNGLDPGKKSVFPYPPVRWDPVVMSQR